MMKYRCMAVCGVMVAGLTAAVFAQAKSTPSKTATARKAPAAVKMPAAIEAAFKKAYPNAVVKHVAKEKENGREQYEVESIDGGMARDLIYLADGTVVEYEETIPEASVPAAVVSAIKARYPTATFGRCEKLFKNGKTNYEIALKGAKVKAVELTPDGTWVSPK